MKYSKMNDLQKHLVEQTIIDLLAKIAEDEGSVFGDFVEEVFENEDISIESIANLENIEIPHLRAELKRMLRLLDRYDIKGRF